ncbi:Hypp5505 [Branchiostoma lanceolatum]|uniref:Hypp5505 protein n=1 Tax=Branchiostoma lanceolatum TaxID=7740 RepID=A0A8J9W287_BRALA|nr:Hypp5505 [Branchiostoma lanceolatum]
MKFLIVALVVAAATLADARSVQQRSIADDIKNSMQAALEKALLTTTANNLESSVMQKINETIVNVLDGFVDKLNLDMWITQLHLGGVINLADVEAFAVEQAMNLVTPILDSLKEQGIQLTLDHMPTDSKRARRSIADDIKNSMQAALEKALLTTAANNMETSALQQINSTIVTFLDNFMDKLNLDYWITQLHLDGLVDLTDLEAFAVEQAMNLVTPILDSLKEQGINVVGDHLPAGSKIANVMQ